VWDEDEERVWKTETGKLDPLEGMLVVVLDRFGVGKTVETWIDVMVTPDSGEDVLSTVVLAENEAFEEVAGIVLGLVELPDSGLKTNASVDVSLVVRKLENPVVCNVAVRPPLEMLYVRPASTDAAKDEEG
jgi:hypothetical protein